MAAVAAGGVVAPVAGFFDGSFALSAFRSATSVLISLVSAFAFAVSPAAFALARRGVAGGVDNRTILRASR